MNNTKIARAFDYLKNHKITFIDIGIIVATIVIFFSPVFFEGKLLTNADFLFNWTPWSSKHPDWYNGPSNPILSDSVDSFIPMAKSISDKSFLEIINGYNNMDNWGRPNPSILGTGAIHDPFFIFFIKIFEVGPGLTYLAVLKVFLAGAGMYFFLKSLKLTRIPSLFGAISFMYAIPFIAAIFGFHTMIYAMCPWLFLAVLKLANGFTPKRVAFYGLCVSLIVFSGFPTLIQYSVLFGGFFYIFLLFSKKKLGSKKKFGKLGIFILINIATILFLAFSLLPNIATYERLDLGYRVNYGTRKLHSDHLAQLIYPNFCGNHVERDWICDSNWNETSMYSGVAAILFLLLSLSTFGKKSHLKWFFILLTIFQLLLIFNILDINSLYNKIPVLNINSNTRLAMLIPFTLVISASIGLYELMKKDHKWLKSILISLLLSLVGLFVLLNKYQSLYESILDKLTQYQPRDLRADVNIWTIALLVIIAGFVIRQKLSKRNVGTIIFLICLIVVPLVDLLHFNNNYLPYLDKNDFFPTTHSITYLQENTNTYDRILVLERVFLPSTPIYYGLNTFTGHDFRTKEFTTSSQVIDPSIFQSHGTLGFVNRDKVLLTEDYKDYLKFNRIKYLVQDPNSLPLRYDQAEYQPHADVNITLDESTTSYTYTFDSTENIDHLDVYIYCLEEKSCKSKINLTDFIQSIEIFSNEKYINLHPELLDYSDDKVSIGLEKTRVEPGDKMLITFRKSDKIQLKGFQRFDYLKQAGFKNLEKVDLKFTLYGDTGKDIFETITNEDLRLNKVADDTYAYFLDCNELSKQECISQTTAFQINGDITNFNKFFKKLKPIKITEYDAGLISFDLSEMNENGIVIISENYYKGWNSNIKNTELFKGFLGTMNIYVEESPIDTLTIRYTNPYLKYGLVFTSLSIVCFIFYLGSYYKFNLINVQKNLGGLSKETRVSKK